VLTRSRQTLAAHPHATDAMVAAVLGLVLLPRTIDSMAGLHMASGWTAPVIAAFAVLHVAPALRHRAPLVGYGLACAAMLVVVAAPNGQMSHPASAALVAFPTLFMPSSLVFLAVLHGVAVHAHHRDSLLAVLVAVTGAVLAMIRVADTVPVDYPVLQYRTYLTLAIVIAVVGAWGLGTTTALRTRWAATERAESTRAALVAERTRIARDMHDVVAHSLAVIVRQAEGGALVAPGAPDQAVRVLRTIADVGRDALTDMRGMLGVLRDTRGDTSVREPAPRPSLADLPHLLDRFSGCGLRVQVHESGTAVEDGGGHRDDVPEDAPMPGSGVGLNGLRERVTAVGGTFTARRRSPGFVVRAELPGRPGRGDS